MNRLQNMPRARGFTLIELLIVITIIALLAAALMPAVFGAGVASKVTATEADQLVLSNGCEAWNRKHGYFPPDDLKSPEAAVKVAWKTDNGTNTGIESLVAFLSQSAGDGQDLSALADRFTNTDKDQHGVELPLLHRSDRIEMADAFGTPMAYFTKFGMDKAQSIALPEKDAVPVKAKRRDPSTYVGHGKYQILSAGPDLIFGTDDDIVWPRN